MPDRPRPVADVAPGTRRALALLAAGGGGPEPLAALPRAAPLDRRTDALVRIAALIALDAPPAAYARQIAAAIGEGIASEDILATLLAVVPEVGMPRVIAAAPEVMLALGLPLPEAPT
ncbi:MAG: hypothetical protein EDQ89_03400 [Acidobacteria bacterium]|nr:MAG: hypothetical protein EDQ89_03400 [Acidobacteriota bacterium]MCL4286352.1 carboxymuconolactone decarboxylase family protein [Thermoleophilia bacterium]GIK78749.1 MAG: hypothetical protein BroJett022_24390 [Actinomycetes bacterium]